MSIKYGDMNIVELTVESLRTFLANFLYLYIIKYFLRILYDHINGLENMILDDDCLIILNGILSVIKKLLATAIVLGIL